MWLQIISLSRCIKRQNKKKERKKSECKKKNSNPNNIDPMFGQYRPHTIIPRPYSYPRHLPLLSQRLDCHQPFFSLSSLSVSSYFHLRLLPRRFPRAHRALCHFCLPIFHSNLPLVYMTGSFFLKTKNSE